MGNRFNIDVAEDFCGILSDTIKQISAESKKIRNQYRKFAANTTDKLLHKYFDELSFVDSNIDRITVDLVDLKKALFLYIEEMRDLLIISPMSSENTYSSAYYVEVSKDILSFETIFSWLKEINPNFDEFDVTSPYCTNCGSCAWAIFQRLEGINSSAVATEKNIPFSSDMEMLTGMSQKAMSAKEIERYLLDAGNGAHAIIGIDRAKGSGHWFNAICKNGKVYAIDGQSGNVTEWPPDYGDVVSWDMSVKEV